ncbi:DUF6279 family lipoprotein [Pseudomonas sp. SP16.1]|uniref:DUF6279 family lipoprotein n=1 Tax=Pseudomonas sp. SP16.1 TaxID=3458854 RepID=UPI0040467401
MHQSLILLLIVTLLLGACSRIDLAYRNLDWLIPWKLDDYVALNEEQRAWLEPQLQEHLAWHCSVELPRYLDWLQASQALLDDPDSDTLSTQLRALDQALQRLAVEITPSSVELLRGLSPRQVEQLFEALDKQNAKLREEYVEPPLAQQIAQRAERMSKRLQPWLGTLNERQRARIENWAEALGAQNRIWLDNRLAWQQVLREALEARRGADFAARMTDLLQQRERFHTDAYQASYADNRRALAELLADLLELADATQLSRARQRLNSLHNGLAKQQCQADEAVVVR